MKYVTIVVPNGLINLSSITGTLEILSRANHYWQQQGHAPALNITVAGFVTTGDTGSNFFSVLPADITQIPHTDLIIIPSILGGGKESVDLNTDLIAWILAQYKQGAEVATICSGAFLLAATGLLNGHNCSIHWNKTAEFSELFPRVNIAQDNIITDERGICTNGGAYSFLNLVLYLVEKYFDRATAIHCSKVFQIDIERTSQSQFAIFQVQKKHGDELIERAQTYLETHIEDKISLAQLARQLAISRRNFDRRFIKATGNTPAEYLQRVKVEAARKELERGRKPVSEIMLEVGYSDEKAFREVFRKITGLSPLSYKSKYTRR